MIYHYDLPLLGRCMWIWEESGVFPDIREVALMDQNYIADMMNLKREIDRETKARKKKKNA